MKCRKTGGRTETETVGNIAYAHWLAFLACSATLIKEPRRPCPRRVPPTVDCTLPSQSATEKCPHKVPTSQPDEGSSSNEIPSFLACLALHQVVKNCDRQELTYQRATCDIGHVLFSSSSLDQCEALVPLQI